MKKLLLTLSLGIIVVASVSCASVANKKDTDSKIINSIRDSHIFKTILKEDSIKLESVNGIVTMTGDVEVEFHKPLAEVTVASVKNVKRVNNKLKVKDTSAPDSDAWLGNKVKVTLLFHRNVSGLQTDVVVNNGVVTLRGTAVSQAQKALTTEYARDIQGIKDVRNEMTIVPEKEPKTQTVGEKIDDASISAQVKLALLFHNSTSALKTSVSSENGVVTLSGKAKNESEIALVSKLTEGINGVESVKNKMIIE